MGLKVSIIGNKVQQTIMLIIIYEVDYNTDYEYDGDYEEGNNLNSK